MERLVLIGAGGYAKSVLDSIDYFNYRVEGFLDEFSQEEEHLGYPIIAHSLEELEHSEKYVYFICVGNNKHRKRWYDFLRGKKLRMINVVDKSAIVSTHANMGNACFVGKLAVVNSGATLGDNCIVNTRAIVEHGCVVGNHVNLSTNSVINGDVKVGDGSFIGSCSVAIGQLSIGTWSTVGAGAVVIRDVADYVRVAGVPAHVLKEHSC